VTSDPAWTALPQWTETTELDLIGTAADATGIAHPGDVLVFSTTGEHGLTQAMVDRVKKHLLDRLPGIADVVIVPLTLTAIYRPDPEPTDNAEGAPQP